MSEQIQKAYQDNKELGKLSENIKEKLEQASFKQDNQLEQMYHQRLKILDEQYMKENQEKLRLTEKLRKKKDENKKMTAQVAKYKNKKTFNQQIQCNVEQEEKMKYHSRPKPPITKLQNIFEDVIHGSSVKKIPTTKILGGMQ
mmetsp:Transcript_430/g.475  ORF Transcript_430/g.475 Transcript_430/m.475 type:complete len:143 (-) Transcript_430:193-621(-)